LSDAIRREVEVRPDGKECVVVLNGPLLDTVEHTVLNPPEAIPGASKIFVKLYPGVLSQVVEGLGGIVQMPFG
jgi:hypothetical protein